MGSLQNLSNKFEIESFLRQNTALHAYSIGDLDDFFWRFTTWYGWFERGRLESLFLLYRGTDLPVLLALEEKNPDSAAALLKALLPELPARFYCHLSPALVPVLRELASLEHHGLHKKMSLHDRSALAGRIGAGAEVRRLLPEDLPRILDLYRTAYPENWFDRRMLDTGKYQGAFQGERLVAIAGVHVFSREYGVSALGNVTTLPELRGKGMGAAVTARLCEDLLREVDFIGLNVKADNVAAIRCYEKLGFRWDADYEEFMAEKGGASARP